MRVTTFFKRKQPQSRHVTHVMFWLFLILGFLLQAGVIDIYGHDTEWFLAYLAYATSVGLLAPWIAMKGMQGLRKTFNEEFTGLIEVLTLAAMMLSWIGAFGLYRVGIGYDTFVHIGSTALGVIIFILLAHKGYPRFFAKLPLLLFVAAVLAILGGIWNEVFEWGGDTYFGTVMYGEVGQPDDTTRDFIGNLFGIVIGSVIGVQWAKRSRL